MRQVGQPFVDIGMAIAANLSGKRSLNDVSSADLMSAIDYLKAHEIALSEMKVFSVYWHNNPLAGRNASQLGAYREKLYSAAKTPHVRQGHCQVCGCPGIFTNINRSWFPLAAGSDADPCTFPNIGGKFICIDCFRAVVLLPIGCRFCKGGAYAFHIFDPELQVQAVAEATAAVAAALTARAQDSSSLRSDTELSGRLGLLEIATASRLWGASNQGILSRRAETGATIFSFSNSGTSPLWYQLGLPTQCLDFFGLLYQTGNREVFVKWAALSKDTFFDSICDDIELRRSLAPILAAITRSRKTGRFSREEKQVMKLYEDIALGKRERFDALERIANKIKGMDTPYFESFKKQLSNIRRRERLLDLLREFTKAEKTKLERLTSEEIRVLDECRENEAASLLYLLVVSDD